MRSTFDQTHIHFEATCMELAGFLSCSASVIDQTIFYFEIYSRQRGSNWIEKQEKLPVLSFWSIRSYCILQPIAKLHQSQKTAIGHYLFSDI